MITTRGVVASGSTTTTRVRSLMVRAEGVEHRGGRDELHGRRRDRRIVGSDVQDLAGRDVDDVRGTATGAEGAAGQQRGEDGLDSVGVERGACRGAFGGAGLHLRRRVRAWGRAGGPGIQRGAKGNRDQNRRCDRGPRIGDRICRAGGTPRRAQPCRSAGSQQHRRPREGRDQGPRARHSPTLRGAQRQTVATGGRFRPSQRPNRPPPKPAPPSLGHLHLALC